MPEASFQPWTFLHVNDSHMGTPRSYRFRPAVNKRWLAIKQQMAETSADLLLHGGDLTRDGDTHEYEYRQAQEDLRTLPFPVFVIPGNMDVGNKTTLVDGAKPSKWKGLEWYDPDWNVTERRLDLFAAYFGPINWTFMYRNVRFTGFYTGVAGTGFPHEERMWSMLESIPDLPRAEHHVAVMHYWPFIEHLDEPDWDLTKSMEYDNWYFSVSPPHRQRLWDLLQAAHVDVLLCGHVHTGRPVQTVGGTRIYRTPAAGNTAQLQERWPDAETRFGFQLGKVAADGIEISFVAGREQCKEFGTFGPLGHPTVEERDYSVAREKPPLRPDGR